MKIISKFKDYYDFLNYQYGEDPKHVWERNLLDESELSVFFRENNQFDSKEVELEGLSQVIRTSKHEYYWLIVCGKRFLLFRKTSCVPRVLTWTAYKNSEEIEDDLRIQKKGEHKSKWRYFQRYFPEYFMGDFSQKNLDFCIKHKSPVIVISGNRYSTNSPILGDIVNFVSMYPAEQIYQDISYFMMNQIHGSPDLDPPVALDDKFKIDYHGFDERSFRPKMRK